MKVCVSESACVSVIKAVYDCFMGGKVPNRFEMLKQMCGSVRNISKMIRLLHDFVLTLQKNKKTITVWSVNIIKNYKNQSEATFHH